MRAKRWAESIGPVGARVRLFENEFGIICAEIARKEEPSYRGPVRYRQVSLPRLLNKEKVTKDEARAWARDESAKMRLALPNLGDLVPTFDRVVQRYREVVSPGKEEGGQLNDKRAEWMWRIVLGGDMDLRLLSLDQWNAFIRDRLSGAIDANGRDVKPKARRRVRIAPVAADLRWLLSVIRFAMRTKIAPSKPWLDHNPAAGYPVPSEPNVRRPVATTERFNKLRAVAEQVTMEVRQIVDGKRKRVAVRSYLSTLLDLCWHTGRRISAVLQLQYQDLRLKEGKFGSIRWPSTTDKEDKEWTTPLNQAARAAIDRILAERPGVGAAFLFPLPTSPGRCVSKELCYAWFRKAEALARLPHLEGGAFHTLRRGWATARKHLPMADVMAAGGWKDAETVQRCYQHADVDTLLTVVSTAAEIREVQA